LSNYFYKLHRAHSRSSSLDMRWNSLSRQSGNNAQNHLAAWFGGLHGNKTLLKSNLLYLNFIKFILVRSPIDPLRVNLIKAHHNWILIAYAHMITCHKYT